MKILQLQSIRHAEGSGLVISLPHQETIRSHRKFGHISCPTYVNG